MADVEIGSISGSQGSFVTRKFYRGAIAVGASGDVLTITAPAGRRVRLDWLTVNTSSEENIRVIIDGTSLTDMTQLGGGTGFTVQQNGSAPRNISDVVGRQIIVRKISGSVVNDLTYSYSEGI